MLGIGYFLGLAAPAKLGTLTAQDTENGPSKETADKIRAAHRALIDAADALRTEGRYETITGGPNAYLIMSGGGNAREDLDSGRGVDPETFAAIYAGQVDEEIKARLDRDEQNRVTYNNEIVRMYSRSRLERSYADRVKIAELVQ